VIFLIKTIFLKSSRAVSRVNKLKLAYVSGTISVPILRASIFLLGGQYSECSRNYRPSCTPPGWAWGQLYLCVLQTCCDTKLWLVFLHRQVAVPGAAVHTACCSVLWQWQLVEGGPSKFSAECTWVPKNHDQEVNRHAEQVVATRQLSRGKECMSQLIWTLGFTLFKVRHWLALCYVKLTIQINERGIWQRSW
jgi:hypothetical protein